jgi:hypothetical protein
MSAMLHESVGEYITTSTIVYLCLGEPRLGVEHSRRIDVGRQALQPVGFLNQTRKRTIIIRAQALEMVSAI